MKHDPLKLPDEDRRQARKDLALMVAVLAFLVAVTLAFSWGSP